MRFWFIDQSLCLEADFFFLKFIMLLGSFLSNNSFMLFMLCVCVCLSVSVCVCVCVCENNFFQNMRNKNI